MLSINPFEELLLSRSQKPRFFDFLLNRCTQHHWGIAVITRVRKRDYENLETISLRNYHLYTLVERNEISSLVKLMMNTKPWHLGTFCLIVGISNLPDILRRDPMLISEAVPVIEAQHPASIFGYAFPLDDALMCYGTEQFEQVVAGAKNSLLET